MSIHDQAGDHRAALVLAPWRPTITPLRPATALAALIRSPDCFWLTDPEGRVIEVNAAAEALFGWRAGCEAQPVAGIYTAASSAVVEAEAMPALTRSGFWSGELTVRAVDGLHLPVAVHITALADARGATCLATIARDLRKQRQQQEEQRFHATHDELTGLYNAEGFSRSAEALLAHGRGIVLLCGLDHLDRLNHNHGHPTGDAVLVQIAERLRAVLRADDLAARLTGGTFAILLPGLDRLSALHVADRVLEQMATPVAVGDRALRVSLSIGMATTRETTEVHRLLEHADMAMFLARKAGRSRVEVYDTEAHRRIAERLALREDLGRALDRGELRLVYQPIVALEDERIIGVEALLRWDHPRLGSVAPGEFVPLLEDMDLMPGVGIWVIDEALRQLAVWSTGEHVDEDFTMSVNVSALQLDDELVRIVEQLLDEHGIAGHQLVVELTETSLARSLDTAVAVLGGLRSHGVRVALDDFGTGFSTLGSLQALPIDRLKIDRSFVHALQETGDASLIAGICQMARALGLQTVVEGIEHAERAAQLRTLQCDAGQGYHWTVPLPPEDLLPFLD